MTAGCYWPPKIKNTPKSKKSFTLYLIVTASTWHYVTFMSFIKQFCTYFSESMALLALVIFRVLFHNDSFISFPVSDPVIVFMAYQ